MALHTPKLVAGISIPDSSLAKQATELLIEHGSEFLYNHSLRTFIFASLNGDQRKLVYDPELLYICSVFHDWDLRHITAVLINVLKWTEPMQHVIF